jgi:hypothetical protein
MPRGRHGEVAHNDVMNVRIDANKKERFRLVCEEDAGQEIVVTLPVSASMVDTVRALVDQLIEGRHEEIGALSRTIAKWGEPTDERDAARAHRPAPGSASVSRS